jgi:hypothetical protein
MIGPRETEIVGNWIKSDDRVVGDEACERVIFLTGHYLIKLGASEQSGGWETLFRDPSDGRYWMRTYPHGEWHGGGPPALISLTLDEASAKFPELVKSDE